MEYDTEQRTVMIGALHRWFLARSALERSMWLVRLIKEDPGGIDKLVYELVVPCWSTKLPVLYMATGSSLGLVHALTINLFNNYKCLLQAGDRHNCVQAELSPNYWLQHSIFGTATQHLMSLRYGYRSRVRIQDMFELTHDTSGV